MSLDLDPRTGGPDRPAYGRRKVWLVIVLGVVVTLVVLLGFGLHEHTSSALTGQPAPPFELAAFNAGYDGQIFTTDDLRGRMVVLHVWASWCDECAREMSLLEQAWLDYQERGVLILGVDYLDTDEAGLAYLDRLGVSFPNAPDIGSRIYQDYGCTGVPETFFIDADGVIRYVHVGPMSLSQLTNLLDQLLESGGQ